MNENIETHKREADSENNKEAIAASKKLRVEEENAVKEEVAFRIEADVAEDKGSRHTMEDASVVLLDASLDYPGNLRFSFSFFSFFFKILQWFVTDIC